MSNLMQQTVDWSLYPLRLMARAVDILSRTTADAGAAMSRMLEISASTPRFPGDTDLGGDDIKVVQSWIACTKPGHEQLHELHTELVNYPTSPQAYAVIVLARFLRQHHEYDDADLRYLKPHIQVIERYAREHHRDAWRSHIADPVLT